MGETAHKRVLFLCRLLVYFTFLPQGADKLHDTVQQNLTETDAVNISPKKKKTHNKRTRPDTCMCKCVNVFLHVCLRFACARMRLHGLNIPFLCWSSGWSCGSGPPFAATRSGPGSEGIPWVGGLPSAVGPSTGAVWSQPLETHTRPSVCVCLCARRAAKMYVKHG